MSEATLNEEYITSNFVSISSFEEVDSGPRYTPKPSAPHQSVDSLLWGYDERPERARFDRVQQRLIKLEATLFEEYGTRLNAASRDCLLRLFVSCPSISAPLISSQPDGILVATWRLGLNEELAIKCISPAKLHYSIVSTATLDPTQVDRQWGTNHNPALFFSDNALARRIAS